MNSKIKLPEIFVKILSSLPEQGMGYQIVTITLKNGIRLINRIVTNSCYLILSENEKINPSDIQKIESVN